MTKFFTQYKRPETADLEKGGGELLVERSGYVSAKQQIESFIQSGRLLMSARQGMYDFEDGQDDEMPIMGNIYENDPIEIQQYADVMQERSELIKQEEESKKSKSKKAEKPTTDVEEKITDVEDDDKKTEE